MSKQNILLSVLLIGLLSVSATRADTPPIIAGKGIGRIFIGMPRLDVWTHIGKPTEIHFFQNADKFYTWDTWREEGDAERATVISRRGRVIQVAGPASFSKNNACLSLRAQHPHLRATMYYLRGEVGYVLIIDDVHQGVAWSLYLHYIDNFDRI